MVREPILRAWLWLMTLSAGSAVVAEFVAHGMNRSAAGAAILILALAKSRIILARYLMLDQAPAWLRGFVTVLALYGIGLMGLYLVPVLMG